VSDSCCTRREREPEGELQVNEIDVRERLGQDATIWLRHHEARLTHRLQRELEARQRTVTVRPHRDHIMVATQAVDDVLAGEDAPARGGVKRIGDEGELEAVLSVHADMLSKRRAVPLLPGNRHGVSPLSPFSREMRGCPGGEPVADATAAAMPTRAP
jgi:hypothetical protein